MSSILRNRERKDLKELLKELTYAQLIDELRRRRKVNHDFKLAWVHKDAFFKNMEETAEQVAKEASEEAEKAANNN